MLLPVLSLLRPMRCDAQKGAWENVKANSHKASGKLKSGKSKLKQWKEHIKDWGVNEEYNHHLAIGGKLNSNGWSGSAYYLHKTDNNVNELWQCSFSEIKHEKQVNLRKENTAYPQLGEPSEFIYGKINAVYTFQLGYGREKMLLPHVIEGNISISFRYSGGFSLGMLKPYYLKLIYTNYAQTEPTSVLKEEHYTEKNAETFLNDSKVLGSAKWKKGLDETKLVPGAFGEMAFVIEPSPDEGFIQTITLGINGAIYPKPLPIMAEVKSYPWQASLFVGLALGKRWK